MCGIKIEVIKPAFWIMRFVVTISACRIAVVAFMSSLSSFVDIDQIIGGISEEGLPAMGSGSSRRRIDR